MAVQWDPSGGFDCSCPECGWTASCPDLPTAVRMDMLHRAHNCLDRPVLRERRVAAAR
jgi:hypothetical protein